jgi:hypothetical protein
MWKLGRKQDTELWRQALAKDPDNEACKMRSSAFISHEARLALAWLAGSLLLTGCASETVFRPTARVVRQGRSGLQCQWPHFGQYGWQGLGRPV